MLCRASLKRKSLLTKECKGLLKNEGICSLKKPILFFKSRPWKKGSYFFSMRATVKEKNFLLRERLLA